MGTLPQPRTSLFPKTLNRIDLLSESANLCLIGKIFHPTTHANAIVRGVRMLSVLAI